MCLCAYVLAPASLSLSPSFSLPLSLPPPPKQSCSLARPQTGKDSRTASPLTIALATLKLAVRSGARLKQQVYEAATRTASYWGTWKDCVHVIAFYLRSCVAAGQDAPTLTHDMDECLSGACGKAPREDRSFMFDEMKRVGVPFDVCFRLGVK